jgi:predicted MPP superfamily phosphohydrolase
MKRKKYIWLILPAVLLVLILPGFYNEMKIVRYALPAEGVSQPIRIALVADLHSCAYGEDQRELLEAIEKEAPDLVLLGGDIFDHEIPNDRAAAFLKGIQGKYPCYYVTGNHEFWSGEEGFAEKMAILDAYGVIRLSGDMDTIEIKGTKLNICGVDDPYAWADNGYPM